MLLMLSLLMKLVLLMSHEGDGGHVNSGKLTSSSKDTGEIGERSPSEKLAVNSQGLAASSQIGTF